MTESTNDIRDKILATMLPNIVFDGWTWEGVQRAAEKPGYDRLVPKAVFPGGLRDVVCHFSDWADREMLAQLAKVDIEPLRIRDRIKTGVITRLHILAPHKDAVKLAMTYQAMPLRVIKARKDVWRTANHIWNWAGDTATDYNRYTKRGLLTGVITMTTLAWINNDNDPELCETEKFLDRRIDNVLKIDKFASKTIEKLKKVS